MNIPSFNNFGGGLPAQAGFGGIPQGIPQGVPQNPEGFDGIGEVNDPNAFPDAGNSDGIEDNGFAADPVDRFESSVDDSNLGASPQDTFEPSWDTGQSFSDSPDDGGWLMAS